MLFAVEFHFIFFCKFRKKYFCSDDKDSLRFSILEVQCRLIWAFKFLFQKSQVNVHLDFKLILKFNLVQEKNLPFPFLIRGRSFSLATKASIAL